MIQLCVRNIDFYESLRVITDGHYGSLETDDMAESKIYEWQRNEIVKNLYRRNKCLSLGSR